MVKPTDTSGCRNFDQPRSLRHRGTEREFLPTSLPLMPLLPPRASQPGLPTPLLLVSAADGNERIRTHHEKGEEAG